MFQVMIRQCEQCLFSANRIVSGQRAADIIEQTKRQNKHFVCHKSPKGREIACKGHHDTGISQMSRIAERLGIVEWVDPDTLQIVEKFTGE